MDLREFLPGTQTALLQVADSPWRGPMWQIGSARGPHKTDGGEYAGPPLPPWRRFCSQPQNLVGGAMKRFFLFTLTTILLALFLAGCGGGGNGSNVTSTPLSGNVTINTGDAVNDQIIKFELTVSTVTLTGSGGTSNTGNLLSKPVEVEFVHQAGHFEPLAIVNVPAGTYSGATLSVSNPEVVVVNSGVPTKVPVTLTSS